jgi:hypothetical protein
MKPEVRRLTREEAYDLLIAGQSDMLPPPGILGEKNARPLTPPEEMRSLKDDAVGRSIRRRHVSKDSARLERKMIGSNSNLLCIAYNRNS